AQDLFQRYRRMSPAEQVAERDRLAVAGMLTALRRLGGEFPCRLFAAFEMFGSQVCRYKGVDMAGFNGTLLASVDLPDGFAFGRAVSHGHGWLFRVSPPPRQEGRP